MKKFLALALLSSFALAACQSGVSSESQSSPTAVVEAFYAALVDGDMDTAQQYLDPALTETEDFKDGWEDFSMLTFEDVTVGEVSGNEVSVEMTFSFEGEQESDRGEVEVVEKDGKWWITDFPN